MQSSKDESLLSIGFFVGFSLLESGGEGIELCTPRVTPLHASFCKMDGLVLRYHNISILNKDVISSEAVLSLQMSVAMMILAACQLSVTWMQTSKVVMHVKHINAQRELTGIRMQMQSCLHQSWVVFAIHNEIGRSQSDEGPNWRWRFVRVDEMSCFCIQSIVCSLLT